MIDRLHAQPVLEVDVRGRFGSFRLEARFTAGYGVTALFGRSGAGKTSLVNFLAGLNRPDAGRIAVDGHVLFDSAAGINHDELRELTRDSSSILVPVLPSMMDTHAASRIIADLLLVAKVNRNEQKLAVIANRTRKNTKSLAKLMRFLDSLGIPIISVLRDSQNFVHAAEQGIGVYEMQPSRVRKDVEQIERIVTWLDGWQQRRQRGLEITGMRRQPMSAAASVR